MAVEEWQTRELSAQWGRAALLIGGFIASVGTGTGLQPEELR